jgi:hypothetical protein
MTLSSPNSTKGSQWNGKGRIGSENPDNPRSAKKSVVGARKIPSNMMSISQATNLIPQPADTSTGLEGSLVDAPQFWQKTASPDN